MFEFRIKNLQSELLKHEVDALLITSSYNIAYLSGVLAFSIEEREARVLVTEKNIYLFTDARYTEMVKQKAPFVTLVEVSSENPFSKALKQILKIEKIQQLGFEEENISYKEAADLEEKLTEVEFIPTQDIIEDLREVKDNDEIQKVREACALSDKGFEFILPHIKSGVTELEIKVKLENFIRSEGGSIAFESIVAFGPNSAIPHHLSTTCHIQPADLILLDFGAKVNGYCSDMTRTVFLEAPSTQLAKMYNATLKAQELAIDYLRKHMEKGFETKNAHELASNHLTSMQFPKIPHALGHGVGLQVHELPYISPYSEGGLSPGTIITVEPGLYIPGVGGIRIEDTALITPGGIELLTKSTKKLTVL